MRNCDRPACVGGSGSCIMSFRLDAAVGYSVDVLSLHILGQGNPMA